MRRRGFLKGLIGGIAAGPAALQAIAAKAAPVAAVVAPIPAETAVVATVAQLDIRAILMANMLRDIQTEEDKLFLERVSAVT